jgi:hypothetical protein
VVIGTLRFLRLCLRFLPSASYALNISRQQDQVIRDSINLNDSRTAG